MPRGSETSFSFGHSASGVDHGSISRSVGSGPVANCMRTSVSLAQGDGAHPVARAASRGSGIGAETSPAHPPASRRRIDHAAVDPIDGARADRRHRLAQLGRHGADHVADSLNPFAASPQNTGRPTPTALAPMRQRPQHIHPAADPAVDGDQCGRRRRRRRWTAGPGRSAGRRRPGVGRGWTPRCPPRPPRRRCVASAACSTPLTWIGRPVLSASSPMTSGVSPGSIAADISGQVQPG